jgi:hypothetical protein|tara:strand:+ start:90 stop:302 length:213 start_codon:yes stop_codon:yes gene_type:complete
MFNNSTAAAALKHYYENNNIENFKYGDIEGKAAFECYCAHNNGFFLEFTCAYLDIINDIPSTYPKLPESV